MLACKGCAGAFSHLLQDSLHLEQEKMFVNLTSNTSQGIGTQNSISPVFYLKEFFRNSYTLSKSYNLGIFTEGVETGSCTACSTFA